MTNDARREKRVGLRLPLEVRGQDAAGADFAHSAQTINISGGGARVLLDIQIPPPLRSHFGGRENYRAWAVVCRMERFEGQTSSRIGARFLRDATGDAQASG